MPSALVEWEIKDKEHGRRKVLLKISKEAYSPYELQIYFSYSKNKVSHT